MKKIEIGNKRLTVEKGKLTIEWNQIEPDYYGNKITLQLSPNQISELVIAIS